MEIFVKLLTGKTITLVVESSETIARVEQMIYVREWTQQPFKLLFDGQKLEDSCTLAACIPNRSTLHCSPSPRTVKVQPITASGLNHHEVRDITITVESADTIETVKLEIYHSTGIPPHKQQLELAGNKLQDCHTLLDLPNRCSILHLRPRDSEGFRWISPLVSPKVLHERRMYIHGIACTKLSLRLLRDSIRLHSTTCVPPEQVARAKAERKAKNKAKKEAKKAERRAKNKAKTEARKEAKKETRANRPSPGSPVRLITPDESASSSAVPPASIGASCPTGQYRSLLVFLHFSSLHSCLL
jgi:hypothetical protein